MCAAAGEPAGETADATGGAAGGTGGAVYICNVMLDTQLGRLAADKQTLTFRYCSRASSSAFRIESL